MPGSQQKDDPFSRRRFLFSAGCAAAGAALAGPLHASGAKTGGISGAVRGSVAAAAVPPDAVMDQLSTYMSAARDHALPENVKEAAKQHILDTLAAMISGSQLPPGQAGIKFAREYGGPEVATVVASPILCGPVEAALANGMLAHSDETDDSHAPSQSHPGCSIIAAALAAGEKFGIDGEHFLRAVVLGYDVGTRVTMTLGGVSFQTETHRSTHSIAGVFGAAAAAGCAAHLNSQKMRWLLDYAAQQASGIAAWQRDPNHTEKAFVFAGQPARSGVTAALVVASGWTGIDDIFSGADNFLLAYAPHADPALLVEQLGTRFEITRTNLKKWTVGSPIQAPLDGLQLLLQRHSLQAAQVREVVVRVATPEAAVVNNRDIPDICLQHMIAVMLADGTVTFASAHDKSRMQDPGILKERAKVQLIPDESLAARLPSREAIVEITVSDGSRFTEHVEAVRGTAQNPMSREEVIEKAQGLITPVLGSGTSSRLVARVLAMEEIQDMRELRPLIQKLPPRGR